MGKDIIVHWYNATLAGGTLTARSDEYDGRGWGAIQGRTVVDAMRHGVRPC